MRSSVTHQQLRDRNIRSEDCEFPIDIPKMVLRLIIQDYSSFADQFEVSLLGAGGRTRAYSSDQPGFPRRTRAIFELISKAPVRRYGNRQAGKSTLLYQEQVSYDNGHLPSPPADKSPRNQARAGHYPVPRHSYVVKILGSKSFFRIQKGVACSTRSSTV